MAVTRARTPLAAWSAGGKRLSGDDRDRLARLTDGYLVTQLLHVAADRALAALRLSLGRWSTSEEVDRAAALIARASVTV